MTIARPPRGDTAGYSRSLSVRSRMAGDDQDLYGAPGQPSSQVVGKRISCAKSRETAREMVNYIARWRQEDEARRQVNNRSNDVTLFDEAGFEVTKEELGRKLEYWDILPEKDNQARFDKRVSWAEREAMPEHHRLDRREVEHLTWSVNREQIPHGRDARRLMEEITLDIVREAFADEGYAALWTVHLEHPAEDGDVLDPAEPKHPHAHILVRSKAANGARIQIGRPFLDGFRAICARYANERGIRVTATRREDRREMRDKIANGDAPLRTHGRRKQIGRGRGGLAKRAPEFWETHGHEIEMRQSALRNLRQQASLAGLTGAAAWHWVDDRLAEPKRVALQNSETRDDHRDQGAPGVQAPTPQIAIVREEIETSFADPDEALNQFLELAKELSDQQQTQLKKVKPESLAAWYMLKQPVVFGDITRHAQRLKMNPRLRLALETLKTDPVQIERGLERLKRVSPERIALGKKSGVQGADSVAPIAHSRQAMMSRAQMGVALDCAEMAASLNVLADATDQIVFKRAPDHDFGYEGPTDRIRKEAALLLPHGTSAGEADLKANPEERVVPTPGRELRPRGREQSGPDGRSH